MTTLEHPELIELRDRRRPPSDARAAGETNESLPQRSSDRWGRRRWVIALAVLGGWVIWQGWWVRRPVFNGRGWSQVAKFGRGALDPRLDPDFLAVVGRAALTSLEYAVLGSAFAMVIGLVGGVLTSQAWSIGDSRPPSLGRRLSVGMLRFALAVPRGIHEAIWALIFVFVLGSNPLVAVLAIGLPFGAITAKVIADALDVADHGAVRSLRAAGGGRLVSILYGLAPRVAGDITAYGFYRLECALRSSVVLGAIGVGGLGFELALSFQSLRYTEMWTLIYALVLLSFVVDDLGSRQRRRFAVATGSRRRRRVIAAGTIIAIAVSAWHVKLQPLSLLSARTRGLAGRLADEAWPPRLPRGGWGELGREFAVTVQLSAVTLMIATALGVPLAFLAARAGTESTSSKLRATFVRTAALVVRSIPPTVWALIVLFVVFPGPLAGGIALGIYTAGVLTRLNADVVEQADRAPMLVLRAAGVPRSSAFAYGMVPVVGPRFVALASYRWGVAARETVIVGLVGAGGLGRTLAQQNAAQDEAGMLTTMVALVLVSLLIDGVGRRLRTAFS